MLNKKLILQLTTILFAVTALYANTPQIPLEDSQISLEDSKISLEDLDNKICEEHDATYGRDLQVGIEYENIFNIPLDVHRIIILSPSEITIEGGSVWSIDDPFQLEALKWKKGDRLLITQNSGIKEMLSKYNYKIINKRTRTSIKTNFSQPPNPKSEFTRNITAIDKEKNELMLDDGSIWKSCCNINKWEIGDGLIVGTNSSNWFSTHKKILINIETKNYTKANKVK